MAEELLVNELEAKTRTLDEFRSRLEGLREENQSAPRPLKPPCYP
jgi:hypothetical protein